MTSPVIVQNITASGGTVTANVGPFSTLSITANTGSVSGHAATFEVSNDGSDWKPLMVRRTNAANTIESTTGTLAAAPSYGWTANVSAWEWFRVRTTAHTSGSMAYNVRGTSVPQSAEVGALTTSGTVTANEGILTAGASIQIASAATTNATSVKASAGNLYNINASNAGAGAAYLKLYNKATAPTVGTDIPILIIPIPASGNVNIEFGRIGRRFNTGIALAITGAFAHTDTTSVAANQVLVCGDWL